MSTNSLNTLICFFNIFVGCLQLMQNCLCRTGHNHSNTRRLLILIERTKINLILNCKNNPNRQVFFFYRKIHSLRNTENFIYCLTQYSSSTVHNEVCIRKDIEHMFLKHFAVFLKQIQLDKFQKLPLFIAWLAFFERDKIISNRSTSVSIKFKLRQKISLKLLVIYLLLNQRHC